MSINVMQMIDYYLGPICCKLLLFLRLFSRTKKQSGNIPSEENCKNILIIKFFGMGTILLASPALRGLKKKYKSAKITILTLPLNRELCEMLPCVDEIIYLKIDSVFSFLTSFIRNISKIRKSNFDIIINLEFLTNFSASIVLLAILFDRPKLTVGFSSPFKWRDSVNNINVSFDHTRHISGIYAKMIRSLNRDDPESPYELSFEPEKNTLLQKMNSGYMKDLIKANNNLTHCDFLICVNVNAGDLSLHRRWPKEYFAEIVNETIKRPNVAVLLIGGKKDVEYVSEFKRSLSPSPRIVDLSGKTNIKDLIGLFAVSNLLITNDSGPLHIAEVVGLPTISFFGPETPHLYGLINKEHYVFYQDLYCAPCLTIYNSKTSHCKSNVCLKSIKPERVLEVIENKYFSPKEINR